MGANQSGDLLDGCCTPQAMSECNPKLIFSGGDATKETDLNKSGLGRAPRLMGTVGITLNGSQEGYMLYVDHITPGSSAEAHKQLLLGSSIVTVDGQDVRLMSDEEMGKHIAGPVGSIVTLGVIRGRHMKGVLPSSVKLTYLPLVRTLDNRSNLPSNIRRVEPRRHNGEDKRGLRSPYTTIPVPGENDLGVKTQILQPSRTPTTALEETAASARGSQSPMHFGTTPTQQLYSVERNDMAAHGSSRRGTGLSEQEANAKIASYVVTPAYAVDKARKFSVPETRPSAGHSSLSNGAVPDASHGQNSQASVHNVAFPTPAAPSVPSPPRGPPPSSHGGRIGGPNDPIPAADSLQQHGVTNVNSTADGQGSDFRFSCSVGEIEEGQFRPLVLT